VGKAEIAGQPERAQASSGIGRTIIKAMASKLGTIVHYDGATSGTRAVMGFAVTEPQLSRPPGSAAA